MGTLKGNSFREPVVRGKTAGELIRWVGELQNQPGIADPIWILVQLDTYHVQILDRDRDLLELLERAPQGEDFIGIDQTFGHYVHVKGEDTHEYAIACVSAHTLT